MQRLWEGGDVFWQIYKFENPIKRLKLSMDSLPGTDTMEACFYERIVTTKKRKDADLLLDIALVEVVSFSV